MISLVTDFRCTAKGEFEMKLVMTKDAKWHPHGDSNPSCRDENP